MDKTLKIALRAPAFERIRKYRLVYSALSLATIPPIDLVREADWLRDFLKAKPYTMIPYTRLKILRSILQDLDRRGVEGGVVQFGVWKGGSAALLASAEDPGAIRSFWLFDSWEGLPPPSRYDISDFGEPGKSGMFSASEETAEKLLFGDFGLPKDRVHLIKGWFESTIPKHRGRLGRIALLHIDCDFYESVRLCLDEAFPLLSPGGVAVIDDYFAWDGCKRAVEEFCRDHPDVSTPHALDSHAVSFLSGSSSTY